MQAQPSNQGRQPKRTTKTSQKLTLFPRDVRNQDEPEVDSAKVPESDLYLSRLERKWLPRVTGYCTASSYQMDLLYDFLVAHG